MDGGERTVAAPQQPHRFGSGGGVGGSEFFICFTSRPSSSSMRIPSSKSLPSPGRTDKYRDPAAAAPSLSASLSRRLKSSGSLKGAQSPASIPGVGGSRKKGCPFEAAEPSSPKVTCIGQVKVKTARMKKKKKAMRSSSKRAVRGAGEATFRRLEQRGGGVEAGDLGEDSECLPNRNQRRAHPPLSSICDALRTFGSEFNCFLPCGGGGRPHGSSAGAEREKGERAGEDGGGARVGEKRARGGAMGSCGAAFARWLMAIQESEGVKRGEMVELVVEDVPAKGIQRELRGMEVLMDGQKGGLETKEESGERQGTLVAEAAAEDDGEAVCVPPPNALLLMRCRSDPVRMAALANRFWGSPATRVQVEEDEEDQDEEDEADNREEDMYGHAVQDGKPPQEAPGQGQGFAKAAPALVAETMLKQDQPAMADGKSSASFQHVEIEEGKVVTTRGGEEQQQVQPQLCPEKGERERSNQRHAEATPEMDSPDQQEEEEDEGPKLEEAAVEKEGAELTRSPSPVASTEKSDHHLPAGEQEEAAGTEVVASKARRSTSFSSERHGRRPSLSNEKEEGRRCKDREGSRRHSFSTEKEVRRTSSCREKEGRRSSFSVEGDALRSSLCSEGEGRRRWSFSSEKEVRRPLAEQAVAMGLGAAGEKKRKTKKKKEEEDEGEEAGATREEAGTEAPSFDRSTTTTAPPPPVEGEGETGRRGEKRTELPDCLLLMMYEPKLSMEVSRETWVCTSDFLRCRPHHHRQQRQHHQPNPAVATAQSEEAQTAVADGSVADSKTAVTATSDATTSLPHPSPPPPPPPRAPPAAAVAPAAAPSRSATIVEQKLAPSTAGGPSPAPYGPCGLTRCKSEPMRSTAKMEPDSCFWKSRHRPIGAAGIGF